MIQPELQYDRYDSSDAGRQDLARTVERHLASSASWKTRAELKREVGLSPRQCRLAREGSGGKIICGPLGFKATEHTTPAERKECAAFFFRLARANEEQGRAVLRAGHRGLAGVQNDD